MRHTRSYIAARRLFVEACGHLSSCGMQAPEHAGSVVAAQGLSSCGIRALESMGSVVVVRGLSNCGVQA